MAIATVSSKGQITIPADIRKQLALQAGDKVNFLLDETGRVVFLPVVRHISTLKGLVNKPKQAVSIEEMKATIKRKASQLV